MGRDFQVSRPAGARSQQTAKKLRTFFLKKRKNYRDQIESMFAVGLSCFQEASLAEGLVAFLACWGLVFLGLHRDAQ